MSLIEFLSENRVQVYSILGSLLLLGLIFRLILKRKLKEEYSLQWILVSLVFLVFSVFRPLLEIIAQWAGIHYAPVALLLILIGGIVLILIRFSVFVSKISDQNKRLIQELALLKNRIEIFEKNFENEKHEKK